ncbi:hypothetical protein NVIRENTERO_01903 [Sodalis praecaptivus]|nr:hypothetical protein NVIRENTERO_01903 [Sodalis praecaptivus]
MTPRKKQILEFFQPDNKDWVTSEVGSPPLDVQGVAWLLHGMQSHDKKSVVESVRRTLERMAAGGLLERITVYERRQNRTQGSGTSAGVRCMVVRYGLPGRCHVVQDAEGSGKSIDGEYRVVEVEG